MGRDIDGACGQLRKNTVTGRKIQTKDSAEENKSDCEGTEQLQIKKTREKLA